MSDRHNQRSDNLCLGSLYHPMSVYIRAMRRIIIEDANTIALTLKDIHNHLCVSAGPEKINCCH